MNKRFFECLKAEREIFRHFNSYADIGSFQVFASPGLNEIAHWNLAYPVLESNPFPSAQEVKEISEFFSSKALQGHLAFLSPDRSVNAVEESEYFGLYENPKAEGLATVQQMTHEESELEQFCDLIQISFGLEADTMAYFRAKMAILQKCPGTKFFIIQLRNQIIGGCSVFQTGAGESFMFNVATHPWAQGKGYSQNIIAYASSLCPKPFYTYSHNPIMRQSILPKLGFESLGTMWCVPLSSLAPDPV